VFKPIRVYWGILMRKGILQGFKLSVQRHRLGELLVIKGVITPNQLRKALHTQKETNTPLGQVFLESAVLSKNQLRWILGKQYAFRTIAAALLMFMSVSSISGKKAHAERIADIPAKLTLTSMASEFSRVSYYPAIYGTSEKRSTSLKAFTKWTSMFDRFDRDLRDESDLKVIRAWQNDLRAFKGGSIKSMATKVNNYVNKTRYITDSKNWGKSDYWATPAEFIQRGGDCEDFAIAKYTALRALGVPEERLRIAIVQDTYKNIPHAVLIVYTEDGAVILDNQIKTLVKTTSGNRYRPIFSINRTAWWLHTQDDGVTRVASR
jgi:predicted transglutaminase-like cysteine proteinase